jgi:hypothetical protein
MPTPNIVIVMTDQQRADFTRGRIPAGHHAVPELAFVASRSGKHRMHSMPAALSGLPYDPLDNGVTPGGSGQ